MKKIVLIIGFIFGWLMSFSQTFTPPRSSSAITVQDSRYRALLNFYFTHTHGLNMNGGLDSLGMSFYEDSTGHIWYRDTIPSGGHKWSMILKTGDAGQGTVTKILTGYGFLPLTITDSGTLVLDTATLNNLWVKRRDSTTIFVTPTQMNAQGFLKSIAGISAGGDLTGTYTNPTIALNAVTFAKMQQIPGFTFIANPTASLSNPQASYFGYGLRWNNDTVKVDTNLLKTVFGSASGSFITGAGNFSPLFTTSVSSNQIVFTASNAAPNTIFANLTGSSGPASFSTPTAPTINNWLGYNAQQQLVSRGVGYRVLDASGYGIKSLTCTGCTLDSSISGQLGITVSGGGGGGTNLNVGSGYRWAIPTTNNIKTFFVTGGTLDSSTNSNALTLTIPTYQANLSNSGSGYRWFVPGSSIRSFVCSGCTLDSTSNAGALTLTVSGGGGAVSSVSNSDASLIITPTTGAVVASLNPAHSNTFTVGQNFNGSTTVFNGGIQLGSPFAFAADNTYSIGSSSLSAQKMWTYGIGSPAALSLGTASSAPINLTINGNVGFSVLATRQIQFTNYTGSSSYTGTPLAFLQNDGSGNIIQAPVSSIQTAITNTPSGGFPLFNLNASAIREIFQGTNITIDSTTNPGGYTINAAGGGGTVTTDTTLTGNGSGGSPLGMNQNLVANANYVSLKAFPPTNATLFYGNSITYGYCPSCGGTEVNYPTIIQNDLLNTTINNGAVSSTGVRTAYAYLANNMPVAGAPTMGEAAFNNIRILMSGDTLHRFGHVHAAYRAMAALQFLNPATIQFYFTGTGSVNPNITTSLTCGSCTASLIDTLKDFSSRAAYYRTNVTGQSGTNWWLKSSITANETDTIRNVRGPGIVIGTWADSLGWSRIQVTVDGSVVTTYNPNNRITNLNFDAGFFRYGIQNDAIIIQGLADTVHTVVLTFLDGGTMGGFDYVAGLKSPSACYTTPMYVYDIMHMGAAGYSYSAAPTTQAVQDSCNNSRWNNDLLQFVNAGYPIYAVHENYPQGLYNPGGDPTQIQIDGIHPTGFGQRNIAVAGEGVMNIKQNYNASSGTTYTPVTPVGPTGAVQSVGAAGFTGNIDLVHDSANTGLYIGAWLAFQAYNSSNAFIGYNTKVIGGAYKYINTGFASALHLYSGGSLGFSTAASGSAGGTPTFTTPLFINNAGQVQIGGNSNFTPLSWVDLPAATTTLASLYMKPGTQPTSGLTAGLFYSTSAGDYYWYNGSSWQKQNNQMGTAASGQMTFYTGVNSVTGSSHFLVDNTNFRLGIGASISSVLVDLHVRNDQTGFTEIRSENQNAAGQAGFQGVNDGGQSSGVRIHGSTAAAFGPWAANMGALFSNASAGLAIVNNSASTPIIFAQGSGTPTEQARFAPSGALLVGTSTDVPSSIFTMSSTTRGFRGPAMTTAQRNAISSPADGIRIYNTDTHKPNWYDSVSGIWRVELDSLRGSSQTWQQVLTTGSTLNTTNNVTNTGQTFTWTNGGTGLYKLSGFSHDTTASFGLLGLANDSSERAFSWTAVAAKISPLLPTFNIFAANGLTGAGGDSVYFGGTLNQNTSLTLGGFSLKLNGLPTSTSQVNLLGRASDSSVVSVAASSGTWTPTVTAGTNISAGTGNSSIYSRVGNVVTFSGSVNVTVTAATTGSSFDISIPVSSTFTSANDAASTLGSNAGLSSGAQRMNANTITGNTMTAVFTSGGTTGSYTIVFSGQYLVH